MCYEYSFNDKTLYFVDKNTGKVSHSKLVNKTVGRTLDINCRKQNTSFWLFMIQM